MEADDKKKDISMIEENLIYDEGNESKLRDTMEGEKSGKNEKNE